MDVVIIYPERSGETTQAFVVRYGDVSAVRDIIRKHGWVYELAAPDFDDILDALVSFFTDEGYDVQVLDGEFVR